MELKDKQKNGQGVRYYTDPELENLFKNNGFKVISIYGDYAKNTLDINSKRMIVVGKKAQKALFRKY